MPNTSYSYTVRARDASPNHNETAASAVASAITFAGCAASTVHVESLLCSVTSGSKGNKFGRVTALVADDCGDYVGQVDATGSFAGSFNEMATETTNAGGSAQLTTSEQTRTPAFDFCVEGLSHASLAYDSNDDVVTCCNN